MTVTVRIWCRAESTQHAGYERSDATHSQRFLCDNVLDISAVIGWREVSLVMETMTCLGTQALQPCNRRRTSMNAVQINSLSSEVSLI
jgi:hypothetical protein